MFARRTKEPIYFLDPFVHPPIFLVCLVFILRELKSKMFFRFSESELERNEFSFRIAFQEIDSVD